MEGLFSANVSLGERLVRAVLGSYVIFSALAAPGSAEWLAVSNLFGLYLAASALLAWDPFYDLLYRLLSKLHVHPTTQIRGV